jgi:hypothetical protein
MFWFVLVVLLALWSVGMVRAPAVGRAIHFLPVMAALLLIVRLVSARVVF